MLGRGMGTFVRPAVRGRPVALAQGVVLEIRAAKGPGMGNIHDRKGFGIADAMQPAGLPGPVAENEEGLVDRTVFKPDLAPGYGFSTGREAFGRGQHLGLGLGQPHVQWRVAVDLRGNNLPQFGFRKELRPVQGEKLHDRNHQVISPMEFVHPV